MWSPESCVEGESGDDSVDSECSSEDWFCSDDVENAMVDSVGIAGLEEAEECRETPRGTHICDFKRIFRRERGIRRSVDRNDLSWSEEYVK